MGFWDRDVENSLDSMFDFDRDGKLDICEQAMQFDFLDRMTRDEKKRRDVDIFDEDDDF